MGLFHGDAHRSVTTLELWCKYGQAAPVADYDDEADDAPPPVVELPSSPQVVLERRLRVNEGDASPARGGARVWALVVESSGAVVFTVGDEYDAAASGTDGGVASAAACIARSEAGTVVGGKVGKGEVGGGLGKV